MGEETYCLSCRKYTKNTNLRIVKSKNDRSMIQKNFIAVKNRDLLKNIKQKDYYVI